jgi:hypothetical protein
MDNNPVGTWQFLPGNHNKRDGDIGVKYSNLEGGENSTEVLNHILSRYKHPNSRNKEEEV